MQFIAGFRFGQGGLGRRFADSEPMYSFGDFSLFLITVMSARLVGGFAQLHGTALELDRSSRLGGLRVVLRLPAL